METTHIYVRLLDKHCQQNRHVVVQEKRRGGGGGGGKKKKKKKGTPCQLEASPPSYSGTSLILSLEVFTIADCLTLRRVAITLHVPTRFFILLGLRGVEKTTCFSPTQKNKNISQLICKCKIEKQPKCPLTKSLIVDIRTIHSVWWPGFKH